MQIVISKFNFPFQEPVFLREMADDKLGTGNVQDMPGTSYHDTEQESYQRPIVLCEKNLGANSKKFPSKYGSFKHNCNGLKHIKYI